MTCCVKTTSRSSDTVQTALGVQSYLSTHLVERFVAVSVKETSTTEAAGL